MSAVPAEFIRRAAQLSEAATRPYPNSRKIFVPGSRADLRVAMREVHQSDTPALHGAEANPSIPIYDTSGPYTDPAAHIDLLRGLPPLRAGWIKERGDTERLSDFTSEYTRRRNRDVKLADIRFPEPPRPWRAKAGANVTQMHYARKGQVTPEM